MPRPEVATDSTCWLSSATPRCSPLVRRLDRRPAKHHVQIGIRAVLHAAEKQETRRSLPINGIDRRVSLPLTACQHDRRADESPGPGRGRSVRAIVKPSEELRAVRAKDQLDLSSLGTFDAAKSCPSPDDVGDGNAIRGSWSAVATAADERREYEYRQQRHGARHHTLTKRVTRPIGTHSTTRIDPSARNVAECG